jgi:hypothetical protein
VAEGDQLRSLFGCHGACDDSGVQDGAFLRTPAGLGEGCHGLGAKIDKALGDGRAVCDFFFGDVDHTRTLVFIEMGEFHNLTILIPRVKVEAFARGVEFFLGGREFDIAIAL